MATNVSGRTARRLRLTLAKRIAEANTEASTEGSELGHECKRRCLRISNDEGGDELESSCGYGFLDEESTSGCVLG